LFFRVALRVVVVVVVVVATDLLMVVVDATRVPVCSQVAATSHKTRTRNKLLKV